MLFKSVFDMEKKSLAAYTKDAKEVIALEEAYSKLSDDELVNKTAEFKEKIANGATIKDIKIEAFATVREVATRTLGLKPFEVQLIGGFALLDANIAEMKTGEGKTLTVTLPAYVLALKGEGVHIVTVNDYLATRDSQTMGELFSALGLTTGLNLRELTVTEKREAYNCDITYTTNSELGFDYLRDNMVLNREGRVQRGLKNVLVDEVDSILIDEARTPLIISGSEKKSHNMYAQVNAIAKSLKEDVEFKINVKDKAVHLLPAGIDRCEKALHLKNLYDVENSKITHAMNQALRAVWIMQKDFDYVVKDNKIVIVDQFTGRTMEGRAYSDGLHQAIECKENVDTQKETKTMATITYQNFFRLYDHLSGMTGTAKTEEEEFQKTYSMDVICIPTNQEVIRKDNNDLIFLDKKAKYKYLINLVKERHAKGQPILIGTVAIETSEEISHALKLNHINHQVLNAKHHEAEAEIVANAGNYGAITIATNMAGRGTDIKIAKEVKELQPFLSEITAEDERLDGLLIIGTERHESRRIDNQLRGRSGRQGDHGESIFLVSFEDDLLKRYAGARSKMMLEKLAVDDEPLSHGLLSKQVASAQKQVESINYDIRKTILKYDDVLREQREIVYSQRDYIIDSLDLMPDFKKISDRYINSLVKYYAVTNDVDGLREEIYNNITTDTIVSLPAKFVDVSTDSEAAEILIEEDKPSKKKAKKAKVEKFKDADLVIEELINFADDEVSNKLQNHGEELIRNFTKMVMLKVFDEAWIDHIDEMQVLRESVGLRGYGQIDPLIEYQKDGRSLFEDMIDSVEKNIVKYILRGRIQSKEQTEAVMNKMAQEHDKNATVRRKDTVVNDK